MTENAHTFRTVMRGYEPTEVDRTIAELEAGTRTAQAEAARFHQQVLQLSASLEEANGRASATSAVSDFSHLGERVGQILSIAEAEAAEMRDTAAAEAKQRLDALNASSAKVRGDAEAYAQQTRSAADSEAGRILGDAKRTADQLTDEADRRAAVRREEAEAIYEEQRARAAQAAADFERTLAQRREKAESDFQERSALTDQQLKQLQDQLAQQRAEAERAQADGARRAAALIAEAEQRAEQIVRDAAARADRIKADSDRQLAAAAQRRDSINAQLTNVRQMLATLSGTTPAALAMADAGDDAAAKESQAEGTDARQTEAADGSADEAPAQSQG
jgi:cell division septum initiation protein DivIVA